MPEFTDSLRSGTHCAAVPRPAERPLLSKPREEKAWGGLIPRLEWHTPSGVQSRLLGWKIEKLNFYERAARCPGGKSVMRKGLLGQNLTVTRVRTERAGCGPGVFAESTEPVTFSCSARRPCVVRTTFLNTSC